MTLRWSWAESRAGHSRRLAAFALTLPGPPVPCVVLACLQATLRHLPEPPAASFGTHRALSGHPGWMFWLGHVMGASSRPDWGGGTRFQTAVGPGSLPLLRRGGRCRRTMLAGVIGTKCLHWPKLGKLTPPRDADGEGRAGPARVGPVQKRSKENRSWWARLSYTPRRSEQKLWPYFGVPS